MDPSDSLAPETRPNGATSTVAGSPPASSLPRLLRLAIAVAIPGLAVAAGIWLSYQGWRLLFEQRPPGARDLWQRHLHLSLLLQGRDIYGLKNANYPPGSLMLLYPQLGWLSFGAARWLWGTVVVGLLSGLSLMAARASRAATRSERLFVMLAVAGHYAVGASVGNGQLGLHVLAGVFGLLLLLEGRRELSGMRLLLAIVCILLLLTKPHLGVLFVLLLPLAGGLRALLLALGVYCGLTALAMRLSGVPGNGLLASWWRRALITASDDTQVAGAWLTVASACCLLLLAVWCVRRRRADLWQLAGVLGLATLFLTHHRWYDDVLTLLPFVALLRAGGGCGWHTVQGRWLAGLVCALLLVSVAPGGLYALPAFWGAVSYAVTRLVWVTVLASLMLAPDKTAQGA